ncbi:MAG: glycosyltransferase [Thermodesulfovibrionales bacterium]|jgi:glycosyltransferase involved in cell wall biosynthesis
MKIAHVLSHIAEVHAGVPIATCKLGCALVRLGVDISFWTTGNQDEAVSLESTGIVAHVFPRKWPQGWRYSPDLTYEFNHKISEVDLVHIHEVWNYPQLATAQAAIRHKIPYIWAPRASLEPWRMRYKGRKKLLYFKLLCERIMNHAVCMHAVSDAEIEGFRQLGFCGTAVVVNNGIEPEEFRNLPDPEEADQLWPKMKNKRVVLFLSRISPEKGIDQLIPAWEWISKKDCYSDALLVLAGPDDRGYRRQVKEMLKRFNLTDRVLLLGMVSGRDKLALISRADINTLPSYSEGFSNSILENLAAAKPVLITPGCNFPEVISADAGVCVEPIPEHIEEGLRRLLDMSKAELEAMGQRGMQLIHEHYTWEISARKLITVYQAILEGRAIPEHPVPIPIGPDGKALLNELAKNTQS